MSRPSRSNCIPTGYDQSLVAGCTGQSLEHYARVPEMYDPQRHREVLPRFGMDPAMVARVISSWGLWMTGWPDQARTRLEQSLRRTRESGHPYSLVFALLGAAHVRLWCGDVEDAERLGTEGVSLAREYGIGLFIALGDIIRACVRVRRGAPEAGPLYAHGRSRALS